MTFLDIIDQRYKGILVSFVQEPLVAVDSPRLQADVDIVEFIQVDGLFTVCKNPETGDIYHPMAMSQIRVINQTEQNSVQN